jgi:hypothetical protein
MVTTQYTNASTTTYSNIFANSTPTGFTLGASANYTLECHFYYQGSAATSVLSVRLTGPASPTSVHLSEDATTTSGAAAADYRNTASGFSTAITPTGIVTTAADMPAEIDAGIQNGTTAGAMQVQAAPNGVGTLTIEVGSWCKLF